MNIHNVIKANAIKAAWRDAKESKAKTAIMRMADRLKKYPYSE